MTMSSANNEDQSSLHNAQVLDNLLKQALHGKLYKLYWMALATKQLPPFVAILAFRQQSLVRTLCNMHCLFF